jgi:hypothetical protein
MANEASEDRAFLAFYQEATSLRRDYVDRAWESIKLFFQYCTPLLVGGVTASITLYSITAQNPLPLLVRLLYTILLISFPITSSAITWVTFVNFRRECTRTYEQISIIEKLSEKLGLYDKRSKNRQLYPEDDYYIPNKWINKKEKGSDTFILNMLKLNDKSYKMLNKVFLIYLILSAILIAGIILLFIIL